MKSGPRAVIICFLAAGVASPQDSAKLEIRGVVAEAGLNAPLAGVQITVYQFSIDSERSVFASATTDSRGSFEFYPDHPGTYYVEAKKPEYFATTGFQGPTKPLPGETGSAITLSRDHPQEFVRLALMRLAELTGRVVDDNDKPAGGLFVEALEPGSLQTHASTGVQTRTVTNPDGSFNLKSLPPGQYIVRVSAVNFGPFGTSPVITKFTDEDLNVVGQNARLCTGRGSGMHRPPQRSR